jgi:hypothetical protein
MAATRMRTGQPLTVEVLDGLAQEAEAGFNPEQIRLRAVGRPPLGDGASFRVQFRVASTTFEALLARAQVENRGISEIARLALERYLCDGMPSDGSDDSVTPTADRPTAHDQ